jgi:membrane fusion protein, multidrug efflux system
LRLLRINQLKDDLLAEIDPAPYKAQLDQAIANRDRDQAKLQNARANLNRYTPLEAKGYATSHPTDANGLVSVTQIQPISLIFTLPETTITEIQLEMAQGPVTVLAYSQDDKTQLDQGQLLLIDNQIIQTTGTIRLRATFPNARRLLWPGGAATRRR